MLAYSLKAIVRSLWLLMHSLKLPVYSLWLLMRSLRTPVCSLTLLERNLWIPLYSLLPFSCSLRIYLPKTLMTFVSLTVIFYFYCNSSEFVPFIVSIISLKLFKPDSMFSIISLAKISGSGKLSKSVRLLSLSQKISKLVLSLASISS